MPSETFDITRANGAFAFRLSAVHRPSKNVIQDYALSWKQFSKGVTKFLAGIQAADWPEKQCPALENVLYILQNHEERLDLHDD